MDKKEELEIWCRRLLLHAQELRETVNVGDALARLKECKIIHQQIEMQFDRVENVLRLAFKKSTGIRAVHPYWKIFALTNEAEDKSHKDLE